MAKNDPFYMKADQYWTGPIWINMNYLLLGSLKKNYMDPSYAFHDQANRIYNRLRRNIIDNMVRQYQETGYIWEQYSDVDGRGLRSHPFTGWSALLILIATEQY